MENNKAQHQANLDSLRLQATRYSIVEDLEDAPTFDDIQADYEILYFRGNTFIGSAYFTFDGVLLYVKLYK